MHNNIARPPTAQVQNPLEQSNEPQLALFYKTASIVSTNIANSNDFSCWQSGETTPVRLHGHPFIEFDQPLHRIRVKVKDLATHEVKWDAIYNLNGYRRLFPNTPPLGGTRPNFWTFCVPPKDPPHAFSVDVVREPGFSWLKPWEAFIGSAVVNAYTPYHAPEGFAMPLRMDTQLDPVGSVMEA